MWVLTKREFLCYGYRVKKIVIKRKLSEILSEMFVNLAAGWFGAIFIVPNYMGLKETWNYWVLTEDFVMGIISIMIALRLRLKTKKEIK